ncbi:MAG TPA: metallophosphoesterase [Candidatus Atribacteria bacterium]|nr:metallophosphoesterase [Candidatus Atribacteria bacterium]
MKIGIISDIHSNSEALDNVLKDVKEIDEFICLGDIVGYGADPNYCIRRMKELNCRCIAGNHDFGAVGKLDINYFNYAAREAILWTSQKLDNNSIRYLLNLSENLTIRGEIYAVHGSPREPMWEYILDENTANLIFNRYDFNIYFIGHSHLAGYFSFDKNSGRINYTNLNNGGNIEIDKNKRYIINCGSVGQPRDGNPKASYGIYDINSQKIVINRVSYPIYLTQRKIINAGLPEVLAERLSFGR